MYSLTECLLIVCVKIHRLRTITRTECRRSSLYVCFNTIAASDFCVPGTICTRTKSRRAPDMHHWDFVLFCLALFDVCMWHTLSLYRSSFASDTIPTASNLGQQQMPCRRLCVRKSRSRLHTDVAEHTKHLSHCSNRICMCVWHTAMRENETLFHYLRGEFYLIRRHFSGFE